MCEPGWDAISPRNRQKAGVWADPPSRGGRAPAGTSSAEVMRDPGRAWSASLPQATSACAGLARLASPSAATAPRSRIQLARMRGSSVDTARRKRLRMDHSER